MTLWELWTYGEEPWVGCGALQVLEATERGERLRRPEKAPNNIFDLMYSCWMLKAADRPDFPKIHWTLLHIKFEILEAKMDHIPAIPAHIQLKKNDRFIVLEEASPTTVHGQNIASREYGHVLKNALGSSQPFQQIQDSGYIKPIRPAPSKPPVNFQPKMNQIGNGQSIINQNNHVQAKVVQVAGFQPKPNSGNHADHKVNSSTTFQAKANPAPLPTSKPVVRGTSNRIEISSPIRNSIIHAGHGDGDLSRSWGEPGKIPDVYLKNAVVNPVVGTDVGKGIPLAAMNSNIPIKPSIPKSPPMSSARSTSTVSSGFGSGEGSIALSDIWNKPTPTVHTQQPSQNQIQLFHQNPPLGVMGNSGVNFRQDNNIAVERPKTTMDLPSYQNGNTNANAKKLSMAEQRKVREAFSWLNTELGGNKKFNELAKKNENPKPFDTRNQGSGNVPVTTAASSSTLSTLTLANTPIPSFSSGFSPRSQNGRDPFEIPAEAKSVLNRPLLTDILGNNGNAFNQPELPAASLNPPVLPPKSSSNVPSSSMAGFNSVVPFGNSSSISRPRMNPIPMNKQFNTIGPANSRQFAQEILKELESRNGQLQVTPQQVAQAVPDLDEILRKTHNPQANRLSAMDPVALLPPPSPLFQSLGGTKNHPNTVASIVNDVATNNFTVRPRPASAVMNGSANVNSRPTLSVLEPTPLPMRPTVIPGTAPPSNGAVINNLISTLTTPTNQRPQHISKFELCHFNYSKQSLTLASFNHFSCV